MPEEFLNFFSMTQGANVLPGVVSLLDKQLMELKNLTQYEKNGKLGKIL